MAGVQSSRDCRPARVYSQIMRPRQWGSSQARPHQHAGEVREVGDGIVVEFEGGNFAPRWLPGGLGGLPAKKKHTNAPTADPQSRAARCPRPCVWAWAYARWLPKQGAHLPCRRIPGHHGLGHPITGLLLKDICGGKQQSGEIGPKTEQETTARGSPCVSAWHLRGRSAQRRSSPRPPRSFPLVGPTLPRLDTADHTHTLTHTHTRSHTRYHARSHTRSHTRYHALSHAPPGCRFGCGCQGKWTSRGDIDHPEYCFCLTFKHRESSLLHPESAYFPLAVFLV